MLLSVQNLRVKYGNIEALHGISFHVNRGEIVTLIGANGAGKTTTLLSIMRLPISQYPSIAGPSVVIGATYPGASAKVVEDSVTGVTAGEASGATVYGFSSVRAVSLGLSDPQALRAAGAVEIFSDMAALPVLLGLRR